MSKAIKELRATTFSDRNDEPVLQLADLPTDENPPQSRLQETSCSFLSNSNHSLFSQNLYCHCGFASKWCVKRFWGVYVGVVGHLEQMQM